MESRFRIDLQPLREPEEVLAEILACCPPLTAEETVPLLQADGRILAQTIHAPHDVPPADIATMDGWLLAASADEKCSYNVTCTLAAGAPPPAEPPADGQAFRVMTGAALPKGSHAIVRAEDGQETPCNTDKNSTTLQLQTPPPTAGNYIRRRGAELNAGDVVLTAGTLLRPPQLGVAATMGCRELIVHCKPRVGLLCSGNELVDLIPSESMVDQAVDSDHDQPDGSCLFNASAPLVLSWLQREGMTGVYYGRLPDNEADTETIVRHVAANVDVLVTTGGVSAGMFDYLDDVLQRLGDIHHRFRLRIKPGKPLTFARIGRVPVFALPGNPVSTALSCLRFLRPALFSMLNGVVPGFTFQLPLGVATRSDPVLTVFHRGIIHETSDGPAVFPLQGQDSSMLSGLARAHVLVEIPPGHGSIPEGERIQCELFPW